jgi:hypothetical protein
MEWQLVARSGHPKYLGNVRYWVNSGKHVLAWSFSGFDLTTHPKSCNQPPIALLPLFLMSSGLRLDQANRRLGRDYPFKLKIRRSEKRTIFTLCTLTATSAHKHVQIHQHVCLQI